MTTTFKLGRLTLREDLLANEAIDSAGARSLTLAGQESVPRFTATGVAKQRSDLLDMIGSFVPAVFSTKTYLNGYYQVVDTSGEIEDWGSGLLVFRWNLNLGRMGNQSEIDIESRLSGAQTRSNDFIATGERTHAPAIGHNAYWAGSGVPTIVARPSLDGTINVYRGIGIGVNPRWAIVPQNYEAGRCRIIDADGQERAGTKIALDPTQTWEISNGVTSIKPPPTTGTFNIGCWDAGVFQYIEWMAQVGSPYVTVQTFDYITILRNEYEAVVVRFTKSYSPGRLFVDVALRRGSRVVEIYMQHEYGNNMKFRRVTASAGTQTSGYVAGTANDAAGNRYMVGSAKTFTADTANGGVEKLATATLDIGVATVLDGGSAISGDTAAHLYQQYLGMPSEMVRGVRR